jgi:glycosyltransferase involved in cell wall biosynthesis
VSEHTSQKKQKAARGSPRPFVVIGICTFQRNDLLIALLESISHQTGPIEAEISIVIVDNNPTPSVPQERIRRAASYQCQIVHEPRTGLIHARNRLFEVVEAAGADWMIGVDDDATVAEDWLSQWLRGINTAKADIFVGAIRPVYADNASPYISRRDLSIPKEGETPVVLTTANYAVSKKVFSRTAGVGLRYHPDFNQMGGEDAELMLRAKRQYSIVNHGWPRALVYEEQGGERLTLRYHLKRTFCTQLNGFYISVLHRKDGILNNAAPLPVMLTRRTIRNFVKGVFALISGVVMLLFVRKDGQERIGQGLANFARVLSIFPFLFGATIRRYGITTPNGSETSAEL